MADQSKRQRVTRACDSCRSKKDKCDGAQPVCSTCASLCRPCTYKANPKKRGLPTGYIRSLELLWGLVFQKIRGSEDVMRALMRSINLPSHLVTMGKEAEGSDTILSSFKNSTVLRDIEQILVILEQPEEERERNLRAYYDEAPLDVDGVLSSSEAQEWQTPEGLERRGHHSETPLPMDVSHAPMTSPTTRPPTYRTKECGVQTLTDSDSTPLQLPDNAWPLLDIYFSYTQCWFPILEKHDIFRTAFQYTEGEVRISRNAAAAGDHAALWAALTLASIQDASISMSRDAHSQSFRKLDPVQLYNIARGMIPTETGTYEIGHVQAQLILSLIKLGQQDWTATYMLIGHAIRMARHLGLDKPSPPSSSLMSHKQWDRAKHVFLGCFVIETLITSKTSRKPSLRADDLSVVGSIDEDGLEEWHPWEDKTGLCSTQVPRASMQRGPLHGLSTFNRLVSLVSILNEFCFLKYDPNVSRSQLESLELGLQRWVSGLPKSYRIDLQSRPVVGSPHIFGLEMTYQSVASVLNLEIACRESEDTVEMSRKSDAIENSSRLLQLLQTYTETFSFSGTLPIFGMILRFCLPPSRETTSDLDARLQDKIDSYSSHLGQLWLTPDHRAGDGIPDQSLQATMAPPVALQRDSGTNELGVPHVGSASSHHLVPREGGGQTSSNATHTPRSSNPFVPWLSATQRVDDGTSLLPTPAPSLTTISGTNRMQPGQLDVGLNSGPRTTCARSRPHNDPTAIPDINAQLPSGRRYPPTYQDSSIGLGPLVDMHGYGPPQQQQQRIVPDLDALFDELASLDGAEKCVFSNLEPLS